MDLEKRLNSLVEFIELATRDANSAIQGHKNIPPGELCDLSTFNIEEDLIATDDFIAFKGNFGDKAKPTILKIRPSKPKASELKQLMECMQLTRTNKYGKGFGFYKAKCLTTKAFSVNVIYPWVEPDLEDGKEESEEDKQQRLQEQQKVFDKFYKRTLPKKCYLVRETPEMYQNITLPSIQAIPVRHLQWVYDILEGKREAKGIVAKDDDPETGWVAVPDSKWKSHPNVEKIPKTDWKLNESIAKSFYLLALVRDRSIQSLRDLTGKHIPLLQNLLHKTVEAAKEIYNLDKNEMRIFVHYQPQYWHFHVHFTSLAIDYGIYTGKAILLEDVIENLKMDPQYYQKTAISCVVSEDNPLLQKKY